MIHFGFSYIGLIWLIMLIIPNLIFVRNKPIDYENIFKNENKVLLFFERIGQVLTTVIVLIFSDFNIDFKRRLTLPLLLLSFILMILYEFYWIRYFKSEKTLKDFYASFLGLKVAGATYPILAFFILGLYGANAFLLIAVVIFGIGHIGIHLKRRAGVFDKKRRKLPLRIIKGFGITIFGILVLCGVVYFSIRNTLFIKAFAGAKNPVFEDCFVELNGQEQFIRVMGKNKDNPVIILLHGGPASPDGMIDYCFMDYLLDDYTYITWDQRGCGRTYYRNRDVDPENRNLNEEQILEDIDALVDYALKRFDKANVTILGHSWGTLLSVRYTKMHPEKINKTICIGQVTNILEGETESYEHARALALESGDDVKAMDEAYGAFLKHTDLFTGVMLRSLTDPYNQQKVKKLSIYYGAISPYLGIDDLRWMFIDGSSAERIYKHDAVLMDYIFDAEKFSNIWDIATEFKVPMYFISGEMDYVCSKTLAKKYCEDVIAPDKGFYELEGCGHTPQADKPKEVAEIISEILAR